MKYKIGDKVKIREDLVVGNIYGADDFARGMEKYKGKIATISSMYDDNRYYIDINDDECEDIMWRWTDEMFEDVKEVDNDNKQVKTVERTVDVGFHFDYCGHKVLEDVLQGETGKIRHYYTKDYEIQYIIPIENIDFIVPHED